MQSIHPLEYHIQMTPDLERFQFKGRVTISFSSAEPVESVKLNILELAVWRCRLKQDAPDDQWIDLSYSVDPAHEYLIVYLPQSIMGDFRIQIDYEGLINDRMTGFYRSRFSLEGQTRYIAVTQFQESSARQAFPCLDHPVHKAVFNLELTIPEELTAVANTLPTSTETLKEHGIRKKRVVFEPSPKMSTYLVFIGVGAFEQVQDDLDPRVRVIHLPGMGHTTSLGLSFGRQALQYCEEYYGIPYPLSKMDLIAVPDFAYGAMENWGAITFRENLLLHFQETTSKAGVQRICEVIAHEIAHQWFGNLVTPEDWKYLWLNESFATYFGYGAVAHYNPKWEVWQQFLNNETATALARDGLKENFAIEIPGGEHVVINSSTAPIIYNKGASILRMIEGYIGTDKYRMGVRTYLNEHRYGCAQSRHLWEAFEQASSQPITDMMQSWIGQSGHPIITIERNGSKLNLSQKRFAYLDDDSDQTWIVPVTLTSYSREGVPTEHIFIMDSATATIDLPEDTAWYKLNNRHTGFFRTRYEDKDNLAALGRGIQDHTLCAEDRWGIQNDLFALVSQGSFPLTDYLEFLVHYEKEEEYLPLASICDHLLQAFLIVPDQKRSSVAEKGRLLTQNALDRMGNLPVDGETFTVSLLRDQLIWQAVLWQGKEAQDFAEKQFQSLLQGESVHADIAKSILVAGARQDGNEALNWLQERFPQSPSEHERINILMALGAFRQWPLIEQALAFTLEHVPPRNRFLPIAAAAANPAALPHLWTWYKENLTALEAFHPLLYERVITSVWPYAGLDHEEEVIEFGKRYIHSHPHLADAIKLSMENLDINMLMRNA